VPRERPNHACRARRASVVGNTPDRRCLCAHLLARQPTSLTRLLTRELCKCEAIGAERSPCHACRARRASVVSNTRTIEDASARMYLLYAAYIPYSLTREGGKCGARCRRDRPNHACRARRVSVVSDTRDRRCLCANVLAICSLHPLLAYSRGR
jgi:hypothetical protein